MSIWDISDSQPSVVPFLASAATVGTNDRPQLSPLLTSPPLIGADPPLTWHTLNSFMPIFELLGPKFVLDQNAYYIHGLVDDNDLAILQDYRSMVTEFILTDGDAKPNIAPSTFFHIAQLLEPNSGLLPSLLRLRILHHDTYFPYLHLLHSPSLKTLEVTNVPDHQHPTFYSFLTTLVHKAPFLEDIIIGPGRFPLKSLQAVLKFTHLRQLELRDVASTIDFTFLQDVGALLNLESFILDARSCEYLSCIPEQSKTPSAERTEFGSQIPNSSSDIDWLSGGAHPNPSSFLSSPILGRHEDDDREVDRPVQPIYKPISDDINSSTSTVGGFHQLNNFHFVGGLPSRPGQSNFKQIADDPNSSTSIAGGFYQLKKLHFIGGLLLIQDMIAYIASSTLEDISITVIRLSHQDLKQQAETEVEKAMQAEAGQRRRVAEEKQRRIVQARESPTRKKKSKYLGEGRMLVESEDIWAEDQEIAELKRTERVNKVTQATFDLHTALYITVLQTVSSRWSADLKAVRFSQLGRSSEPLSLPPALPKQVYETLFCHPKIEILELKRWKLDSVEDFLCSLKSSGPKNLKQLHLPIDDPDTAVSLSGLLDIAEACPMLDSLQCCISTLPPIPDYSIPATKALSHRLQTLFVVNNPTSLWDFSQLLLVARHLYLMFPHLQTINNVEGSNAEQWVRIRDLVKMFQTIHEDDMYRFSEAYQRPSM